MKEKALFINQVTTAFESLELLAEGPGYYKKLRELATAARLKGGRIHDARIDCGAVFASWGEGVVVGGPGFFDVSAIEGEESIGGGVNDFDRMDKIDGMEFEVRGGVEDVRWNIGSLPITNRRYGRLQICVTGGSNRGGV